MLKNCSKQKKAIMNSVAKSRGFCQSEKKASLK